MEATEKRTERFVCLCIRSGLEDSQDTGDFLPRIEYAVPGYERFIAFHARLWNGRDYGDGALFTLGSTDAKPLKESTSIRIFDAFGPATFVWQGKTYEVKREDVIKPGV